MLLRSVRSSCEEKPTSKTRSRSLLLVSFLVDFAISHRSALSSLGSQGRHILPGFRVGMSLRSGRKAQMRNEH